ncbi:MAG: Fe-S-cluster-containing dehydrogenase component [Saprospiraceae bacterium]|jgi:Fe-S-cluster-containing dehydrogenase component
MSNKIEGVWIGEKDLSQDEQFLLDAQNEMQSPSLVDAMSNNEVLSEVGGDRRDFLKLMGFGLGAATMAAGCDIPVKRAIPYVIKPDAIVPGVATYYASTIVEGGNSCPVLVKTREGRPIKIEGNNMSSMTNGGTSARVQASVLSLYDVNRLKHPSIDGAKSTWADVDENVKSLLASAKGIRIVSNTILSPTAMKAMDSLKAKYDNVEVIQYDPVSVAGLLEANAQSFGDRVIPQYRFDKADVIVSFNADFLGTWISPIEFANQYAKGRKIEDAHNAHMSKHVQVESQMSMTGSNADNRILVKPSEQGAAIAYLYGALSGTSSSASLNDAAKKALKSLASQLKGKQGKALVISGSNNAAEQVIVNAINGLLGSYGNTISFAGASLQRKGDEKGLVQLIADIKSGRVDTVIYNKCNPVFEYAAIPGLTETLGALKNSVALSYDINETSTSASIIAPVHHDLESWGDAEAKRGELSLIQPTISPLFDTRQGEMSILTWAGDAVSNSGSDQPYFEYVKANWGATYFNEQEQHIGIQSFWDSALHDGVVSTTDGHNGEHEFAGDISTALKGITKPSTTDIEIQFIESIAIGNGIHANNPWLQEMPDPVSRCAWGNYLAVPVDFDGVKKFSGLNGLKDGELADLTINGQSYRVPVIQQFGQMKGTVALAMGYGREKVGDAGWNIGVNVNPAMGMQDGRAYYAASDVQLSRSQGEEDHYSSVQYHHTLGVTAPDKETGDIINADERALAPGYGNVVKGYQGSLVERSIIRHANVNELEDAVEALVHEREHHEGLNAETLYPYSKYVAEKYSQGHHWGMHVDLNACTGCGACTVACMAENNVPVVGKKQISRHQEMAWLRIDRYYYGDVNNPNVVYQPLMCQHCDNAPCENVCPVNATNHSSEGLNQMTYNRCIGTRYCANNCPYKVRRFNWLDYTTADLFPGNQVSINNESTPYGADDLTRMVLNPDVTVRSRGVIEKCTFCVQRIQEGKLTAKQEGRRLQDTDVVTACQSSCPTGAITFGDQNNENGDLSKKFESPLNMIVLEEINVRPSVQYTMKVHNRDEALEV